jgi:VanZ family protein
MRDHHIMTVLANNTDPNRGLRHWLARARRKPLALSLVYACIIIYASLYSTMPWQDRGVDLFGFWFSPWPKYWTWQDASFNVLAYLPLGFLLALSPQHTVWPWARVVLPLLAGLLLSATLEAIQTFLPGRVSSGSDLVFNTAGTLIGIGLALFWGPRIVRVAGSLRRRLGIQRVRAEAGLILLALWLFAQISPETVFFGFGDLRGLLALPTAFPFSADFYSRLETVIAALQFLVMVFLVQAVLQRLDLSRQVILLSALCIILLGILIRVVSSWLLLGPSLGSSEAARWVALTSGGLNGMGIGLLLSVPVLMLPRSWRMPMACMLLMAATVLVNLMPTNPYSVTALTVWRQGHFLNFNGLTRLIAALWPYLTLFFLVWTDKRRSHDFSPEVH